MRLGNFIAKIELNVQVLSTELRGGIKWLLYKSVTLHKTVILPQIMVVHACAHQAFCTKIARSAKTAVLYFPRSCNFKNVVH